MSATAPSAHGARTSRCDRADVDSPRAAIFELPLTLALLGVALLGLVLLLNASAERALRREERIERQFWRSVKADWQMIQASAGLKDS